MGQKIVEVALAIIASIIIYNILTNGQTSDALAKDTFNFLNTETRSLEGK